MSLMVTFTMLLISTIVLLLEPLLLQPISCYWRKPTSCAVPTLLSTLLGTLITSTTSAWLWGYPAHDPMSCWLEKCGRVFFYTGNIVIAMQDNNGVHFEATLQDVIYVLGLSCWLFSLTKFARHGTHALYTPCIGEIQCNHFILWWWSWRNGPSHYHHNRQFTEYYCIWDNGTGRYLYSCTIHTSTRPFN